MKKLRILSVITFLAAIVFVAGCVKDPPTPDPTPTPVNPIISVTGIPDTPIPFGDSVTFFWNIKNYVSAQLNGTDISATGTQSTSRLLKDTTFKIDAVGPYGGAANASFTIKVGDWKTSDYGIISHDYWRIVSEGYKVDTLGSDPNYDMIDSTDLNPEIVGEKWYFKPKGRLQIFSGGNPFPSSKWELLPGDTIFVHPGNKYKVNSLSRSEMILLRKGSGLDASTGKEFPVVNKTIYHR